MKMTHWCGRKRNIVKNDRQGRRDSDRTEALEKRKTTPARLGRRLLTTKGETTKGPGVCSFADHCQPVWRNSYTYFVQIRRLH